MKKIIDPMKSLTELISGLEALDAEGKKRWMSGAVYALKELRHYLHLPQSESKEDEEVAAIVTTSHCSLCGRESVAWRRQKPK